MNNKMIYEPTAWYSYSQFSDIFELLSDPNEYERILFQIDLWKARGRVPSAVHATSFLLKVFVCDKNPELPRSYIRDLYAMSIIRTVNLLLDQEQDSVYAKSMLLMGKEANIPENVIKFRHRCSHGDIPDLESLRIVCREAFNYVYKKYWTHQYNLVRKLDDDDHFTFLLFSTFLLSRSGIDTSRGLPYSNKRVSLYGAPRRYKFNLGEAAEASPESKCVLTHLRKIINLMNLKKHLSLYRRLNLYAKKRSNYEKTASAPIFIAILKKILNYCAHEDIFISLFVECVFSNYSPFQSQVFLLMLFYVTSQYSFNFTFKLISHMFNFIFDISDIFTNIHTHEANSILRRINSYHVLLDLNSSNEDLSNYTDSGSYSSNSDKYKNNVNEWLLTLLQYAICLRNKQFYKYHLNYLRLIKGLPYTEYDMMLDYEFTALSRILKCVSLILPVYIFKFSNSGHNKSANIWKDRLSHFISFYEGLLNGGGSHTFCGVDEENNGKVSLESNTNFKKNVVNINKNLLPGTLWDINECRLKYTYPLDKTSKLSVHERLLASLDKITACNIFGNDFGDKRLVKVQSKMYSIKECLESGKERARIQKRMFRFFFTRENNEAALQLE